MSARIGWALAALALLPSAAAGQVSFGAGRQASGGESNRSDQLGRALARAEVLAARLTVERARARALSVELGRVTARSVDRELELLRRQQALVANGADGGLAAGLAQILEDLTPEPEPEPTAAAGAEPTPLAGALQRGTELRRKLNGLLRTEGVGGFELLEAGVPCALDPRLADGPGFGTGPVVFRRLDADGGLIGGLAAERLSLEASRSGRTLSLLLHGAEERIRGEVFQLEQNPLRIDLEAVDADAVRELLPELFASETEELRERLRRPFPNRAEMQVRFQALLSESRSGARYELQAVGGRDDQGWLDVRFLARDSAGRADRYLVADRMALGLRDGLVTLELRDGATLIGERRVPFLDGRLRIVLSDADADSWIEAGLPGFRQLDPEPPAEAFSPPADAPVSSAPAGS